MQAQYSIKIDDNMSVIRMWFMHFSFADWGYNATKMINKWQISHRELGGMNTLKQPKIYF